MPIGNILPMDGEAYFFPAVFTKAESNRLWFSLQKNIPWAQTPVLIMGKEIMQPRLTAWYGDTGKSYSYTGVTMHPRPWTDDLWFIKERIETISGQLFNSALLNYYRDGQDSVGWHRDNERSLGIHPVIGSVSFGTARFFHFKHYKNKDLTEKILLSDGSFLLMQGETQHKWLHSIKKEPKVHEGRINITFRTIVS